MCAFIHTLPSELNMELYWGKTVCVAKEGIILSWAVPGQGGLSHINNKPIEYVTKVMRDNGFKRPNTRLRIFLECVRQLLVILSNRIVEYQTAEW
jgi:hypothetical protein